MIVFRVVAGLLIAGALIHVSTVWPRVIALVSALDARVAAAWLVAGGFAVSALTALLACADAKLEPVSEPTLSRSTLGARGS